MAAAAVPNLPILERTLCGQTPISIHLPRDYMPGIEPKDAPWCEYSQIYAYLIMKSGIVRAHAQAIVLTMLQRPAVFSQQSTQLSLDAATVTAVQAENMGYAAWFERVFTADYYYHLYEPSQFFKQFFGTYVAVQDRGLEVTPPADRPAILLNLGDSKSLSHTEAFNARVDSGRLFTIYCLSRIKHADQHAIYNAQVTQHNTFNGIIGSFIYSEAYDRICHVHIAGFEIPSLLCSESPDLHMLPTTQRQRADLYGGDVDTGKPTVMDCLEAALKLKYIDVSPVLYDQGNTMLPEALRYIEPRGRSQGEMLRAIDTLDHRLYAMYFGNSYNQGIERRLLKQFCKDIVDATEYDMLNRLTRLLRREKHANDPNAMEDEDLAQIPLEIKDQDTGYTFRRENLRDIYEAKYYQLSEEELHVCGILATYLKADVTEAMRQGSPHTISSVYDIHLIFDRADRRLTLQFFNLFAYISADYDQFNRNLLEVYRVFLDHYNNQPQAFFTYALPIDVIPQLIRDLNLREAYSDMYEYVRVNAHRSYVHVGAKSVKNRTDEYSDQRRMQKTQLDNRRKEQLRLSLNKQRATLLELRRAFMERYMSMSDATFYIVTDLSSTAAFSGTYLIAGITRRLNQADGDAGGDAAEIKSLQEEFMRRRQELQGAAAGADRPDDVILGRNGIANLFGMFDANDLRILTGALETRYVATLYVHLWYPYLHEKTITLPSGVAYTGNRDCFVPGESLRVDSIVSPDKTYKFREPSAWNRFYSNDGDASSLFYDRLTTEYLLERIKTLPDAEREQILARRFNERAISLPHGSSVGAQIREYKLGDLINEQEEDVGVMQINTRGTFMTLQRDPATYAPVDERVSAYRQFVQALIPEDYPPGNHLPVTTSVSLSAFNEYMTRNGRVTPGIALRRYAVQGRVITQHNGYEVERFDDYAQAGRHARKPETCEDSRYYFYYRKRNRDGHDRIETSQYVSYRSYLAPLLKLTSYIIEDNTYMGRVRDAIIALRVAVRTTAAAAAGNANVLSDVPAINDARNAVLNLIDYRVPDVQQLIRAAVGAAANRRIARGSARNQRGARDLPKTLAILLAFVQIAIDNRNDNMHNIQYIEIAEAVPALFDVEEYSRDITVALDQLLQIGKDVTAGRRINNILPAEKIALFDRLYIRINALYSIDVYAAMQNDEMDKIYWDEKRNLIRRPYEIVRTSPLCYANVKASNCIGYFNIVAGSAEALTQLRLPLDRYFDYPEYKQRVLNLYSFEYGKVDSLPYRLRVLFLPVDGTNPQARTLNNYSIQSNGNTGLVDFVIERALPCNEGTYFVYDSQSAMRAYWPTATNEQRQIPYRYFVTIQVRVTDGMRDMLVRDATRTVLQDMQEQTLLMRATYNGYGRLDLQGDGDVVMHYRPFITSEVLALSGPEAVPDWAINDPRMRKHFTHIVIHQGPCLTPESNPMRTMLELSWKCMPGEEKRVVEWYHRRNLQDWPAGENQVEPLYRRPVWVLPRFFFNAQQLTGVRWSQLTSVKLEDAKNSFDHNYTGMPYRTFGATSYARKQTGGNMLVSRLEQSSINHDAYTRRMLEENHNVLEYADRYEREKKMLQVEWTCFLDPQVHKDQLLRQQQQSSRYAEPFDALRGLMDGDIDTAQEALYFNLMYLNSDASRLRNDMETAKLALDQAKANFAAQYVITGRAHTFETTKNYSIQADAKFRDVAELYTSLYELPEIGVIIATMPGDYRAFDPERFLRLGTVLCCKKTNSGKCVSWYYEIINLKRRACRFFEMLRIQVIPKDTRFDDLLTNYFQMNELEKIVRHGDGKNAGELRLVDKALRRGLVDIVHAILEAQNKINESNGFSAKVVPRDLYQNVVDILVHQFLIALKDQASKLPGAAAVPAQHLNQFL